MAGSPDGWTLEVRFLVLDDMLFGLVQVSFQGPVPQAVSARSKTKNDVQEGLVFAQ